MLTIKRVKAETTPLEEFASREGKFKDVAKFGLSEVKEYTSKKKNLFFQCEKLAFVRPGQFVRVLKENPNAKFGKLTKLKEKDEDGNDLYDLELFEDTEGKYFFNLSEEGLCSLNN